MSQRTRVTHGATRVHMPQPMKVTFTAKELCAAHLAGEMVLRALGEPYPQLERAVEAMRDTLERNGCRLDDDGWVAT